MKKPIKFTAAEKRKIAQVCDALVEEMEEHQRTEDELLGSSLYDNDYGCDNCGDLGPFFGTIWRLKQKFGIKESGK